MKKSIIYTVVMSFVNIALLIVLCLTFKGDFWKSCLCEALIFWLFFRLIGSASTFNFWLLFTSIGAPLMWIVFFVVPSMIQSTDDYLRGFMVLRLAPDVYFAAWMEALFNKIKHKKPLVIPWPWN